MLKGTKRNKQKQYSMDYFLGLPEQNTGYDSSNIVEETETETVPSIWIPCIRQTFKSLSGEYTSKKLLWNELKPYWNVRKAVLDFLFYEGILRTGFIRSKGEVIDVYYLEEDGKKRIRAYLLHHKLKEMQSDATNNEAEK
jgi:hypothetical protein